MAKYLDKDGVTTVWNKVKSKISVVSDRLDNFDSTKANATDLSNVLAEEVIDAPLLEEVNTLTRETIKKDLFIDMWNQACGTNGRYNAETGYFELNGLTDITYEQAIDIYNAPRISYPNIVGFQYINCRTLIKISNGISRASLNLNNTFIGGKCEILLFGNVYIHSVINAFENCQKLKMIIGNIILYGINNTENMFKGCNNLTIINLSSLKSSISFVDSSLLSLESFQYMIANAANDTEITITVHPDVYAKLTDVNNAEWYQVLTDATAKQIIFATV